MNDLFDKFNDDEAQMSFGDDMRKYEWYAVIAYIVPVLFFFPYLIDRESEFCKFHANQAFCWFIVFAAAEIISGILSSISPVVQIFSAVITLLIILTCIFLALGAYKGYAIRIPVIGSLNIFK